MTIDLNGKVFVVTGGNGGIGLGLAEGTVDAGGRVAVWGRDSEKNAAAVDTLRARALDRMAGGGPVAIAYRCDVADENQVVGQMDATGADFGRIDGLFANAGRGGTGAAFVDTTLRERGVSHRHHQTDPGPPVGRPVGVPGGRGISGRSRAEFHTGQEVVVDGGYTVF